MWGFDRDRRGDTAEDRMSRAWFVLLVVAIVVVAGITAAGFTVVYQIGKLLLPHIGVQ